MDKVNKIEELQSVAQKAQVSDVPAEKVMSSRKPLTIMSGAKIYSVIQTLCAHGLSGAPVVDASGKIIGVISEHDLLLQAATKDLSAAISINENVISAEPKTPLKDLIILFHTKKVKWLPIVDDGKRVVGVVHRIDVLNCLISRGK